MSAGYDDRIRGFAAFPRGTGARRKALSWWGNEWVAAVEASSVDPAPLTRGRAEAYAGRVGPLTVTPGRVAAVVQGGADASYRTEVLLGQLTDQQWQRFLHAVAAEAGHIAALIDRDMPHDLVDAAADAGVRLLPALGDLEPVCSCDEYDSPCRHAAAVCYQVAWLLDDDPFLLLLIRGRSERQLVAELQEIQERDAGPEPAPPGAATASATLARDAFAAVPQPLPELPPVPDGQPPAVDVPSALGVDSDGIRWLVRDAAVRAREWLMSGEPPAQLDSWQDTVRLAGTHADHRLFARLRSACGRPDELARAAKAWEYGGANGLDVLETPRSLTRAEQFSAAAAIAGAWDAEDAPAFAVSGNRWTLVGRGLQVRYGRDARWYPYRDEGGEWWPAGPPQVDPAVAVADLL